MRAKIFLCILFVFFFSLPHTAQNNPYNSYSVPRNYDPGRGTTVFIAEGVLFTGALIALDRLWYKKFPRSRFHFFNDNAEWLQMDKIGHATTAYNLGVLGISMLQYTGMKPVNAAWYGALTGLAFLTAIEALDGFSSDWGFSSGDMVADLCGTGLVLGEQLGWNEQRLQLKISFHRSLYSSYNSRLLGKNFWQRLLKDYNGQTYWLSGNISEFIKSDSGIPGWLSVSIGYGAEGMIAAQKNPAEIGGQTIPFFERKRRFFLAPDIDLSRINSNSVLLNTSLKATNFLKIPVPALEYKSKKLLFHPLYH